MEMRWILYTPVYSLFFNTWFLHLYFSLKINHLNGVNLITGEEKVPINQQILIGA